MSKIKQVLFNKLIFLFLTFFFWGGGGGVQLTTNIIMLEAFTMIVFSEPEDWKVFQCWVLQNASQWHYMLPWAGIDWVLAYLCIIDVN